MLVLKHGTIIMQLYNCILHICIKNFWQKTQTGLSYCSIYLKLGGEELNHEFFAVFVTFSWIFRQSLILNERLLLGTKTSLGLDACKYSQRLNLNGLRRLHLSIKVIIKVSRDWKKEEHIIPLLYIKKRKLYTNLTIVTKCIRYIFSCWILFIASH